MADVPEFVEVSCFTCSRALTVRGGLVERPDGTLTFARYRAPFICDDCRGNKKKLTKAREAMFRFIGRPDPVEGFDG